MCVMACYQSSTLNGVPASSGPYATKADCLQACREGACCTTTNGITTCAVVPACDCTGPGKTFKGIGTVCGPSTCVCTCDEAIHPQTLEWSLVVAPYDFRPFSDPTTDPSIYGVNVQNGYSCGGTVTLDPIYDNGIWEYWDSMEVPTTGRVYILTPDQDPITGGNGNYLRIADQMTVTIQYTRCAPGVYGHVGPHVSVEVRPPHGIWNSRGGGFSDEAYVNLNAPPFVTTDGKKWQDIREPYCETVCGSASWDRMQSFIDYSSGSAGATMFAPLYTFNIRLTGCKASRDNPLP